MDDVSPSRAFRKGVPVRRGGIGTVSWIPLVRAEKKRLARGEWPRWIALLEVDPLRGGGVGWMIESVDLDPANKAIREKTCFLRLILGRIPFPGFPVPSRCADPGNLKGALKSAVARDLI